MVLFSGRSQEAFFHAPDSVFSARDAYRKMMTPIFGAGIVYDAPSPEVMSEHIAMTFPALTERRLRCYLGQICREADAKLALWGESGEFDLLDFTQDLTLRTAAATLMGPEIRHRLSSEFAPLYHDLERGITPIAFAFPHLPIPAFRRRDAALKRLQNIFAGIVSDRRRTGRKGEDFLQTLMDTRAADGGTLTDQQITGLLIAMLFAGHHTSGATLAWTIVELLANPDQLRQLTEEILQNFGHDGPVTFDGLKEMPLLDSVVREVLRLHPPLIMLIRKVIADFQYGSCRVPAGSFAIVSPAVSHSIPEYFARPSAFDPARFMPGRRQDENLHSFLAFGGGNHRCPGMRFGFLQVKAIVSIILRRYDLSTGKTRPEPDYRGLVVVPKRPCHVRYQRKLGAAGPA